MAQTIELNIRLDTKYGANSVDACRMREQLALKQLGSYGKVLHRKGDSGTEAARILIICVEVDDIPHNELFHLAETLQQDCIGVYRPGRGVGVLIGPCASAWGDFDIDRFVRFDPSPRVDGTATTAPAVQQQDGATVEAGPTPHAFGESKVVYLDATVPDELTLAAADVPSDLGYDSEEGETYLAGTVLQVSWVCDDSTKRLLEVDLDDDCEYPATMLRVDYEAWALPGDFDAEAPDRVSYRREHIYVLASVLRDGAVFSYGLGPEYGFDLWEQDDYAQGTADEVGLPKDVISLMVQEIESNFYYQIEDYLDESSISRSWPKPIQQLYRKVRAAKKAKAAAYVQQQRSIGDEINGALIELEPWVKLNDVTDGIRRLYIDSKTGHFRFILHLPEDFVVGQPVIVKVTKAERAFNLQGYRTVSVKELVCPIALRKRDITAQFEKLALSGWPATEFVGAA